jgi:LPS export ABC transporter protein LptC
LPRKTEDITFQEETLLEQTAGTQGAWNRRAFWVLLAALAVLGLVFFLVKRGKTQAPSVDAYTQGENSPDAVIEKFHLISTVRGEKHWELYSDKARLYQNQKNALAENIYAQYFKKGKIVSTLTADQAAIDTDTNSTQAQGHVELVVENGSKLLTDKLDWNQDTDQIKTMEPVRIYKGSDEITAVGLVADTELNNVHFMKDVHTQVRDTHEIETFSEPKPF